MTHNPFDLIIVAGEDFESSEDLQTLIDQHHLASQATDLLVRGLLSFEDFEDILDTCGIDVEAYSQGVESNVTALAY